LVLPTTLRTAFTADWRGWDADENSVRNGRVRVARANVAAAWLIRAVFVVIRGQAVSSFFTANWRGENADEQRGACVVWSCTRKRGRGMAYPRCVRGDSRSGGVSFFTAEWRGWNADENSVRIGHVGVVRASVAAACRIRGVFAVIGGQAVFPFLPRIGADGTRMRTAWGVCGLELHAQAWPRHGVSALCSR